MLSDLLRLPSEGKHHDWWWSCFVFNVNNGTGWKQNSVSSFWWIPFGQPPKIMKISTTRFCTWRHGCSHHFCWRNWFSMFLSDVIEKRPPGQCLTKTSTIAGSKNGPCWTKMFTWLNSSCRCCRVVRDLHHRCRWNFQRFVGWLFATFGWMFRWKLGWMVRILHPPFALVRAPKKTLSCLPCH